MDEGNPFHTPMGTNVIFSVCVCKLASLSERKPFEIHKENI